MEKTSVEDLKSIAEEMLEMSDEELMEKLPTLVPKMKGKVREIMDTMPDLPQRIVKRIEETDVKKMANEAPDAVNAFTEILWEGVAAVAERDAEFKKALKNVGNIKLNYEADDSPMSGHEEINNAKITGGPGKLNTVDITVIGNTDTLIKLVTGGLDPVKGLMTRKFKLEGPLALGMKLTGAIKAMANALKG
nr:SCP2 sterol-binding domain-containing protein [Candidatus Freyarchaeota archaeon]